MSLADDLALASIKRRELARLEQRINDARDNVPQTPAEFAKLRDVQVKADSAFQAVGTNAPPALPGESPVLYRRRLLGNLQEFVPSAKRLPIADAPLDVLEVFEKTIFADVQKEAARPTMLQPGELRAVTRTDESGRSVTEYFGDQSVWRNEFKLPPRRARFNPEWNPFNKDKGRAR